VIDLVKRLRSVGDQAPRVMDVIDKALAAIPKASA
jgi:hypothetical protein